jgi:ubiquinone/menaquinone biosynthesis C-methylase UbiE
LDNVELVELSAVGLQEIPDNSVDVVCGTVVFMHLYEWDRYQYVREAFRVLKSAGRCFFDNIDITSNHGGEVFMQGFSIPIEQRPAHLSMISTGEELHTCAMRAGFADVAPLGGCAGGGDGGENVLSLWARNPVSGRHPVSTLSQGFH